MGFIKTGTDVQGMIHTGEMVMRYLGCVSPSDCKPRTSMCFAES